MLLSCLYRELRVVTRPSATLKRSPCLPPASFLQTVAFPAGVRVQWGSHPDFEIDRPLPVEHSGTLLACADPGEAAGPGPRLRGDSHGARGGIPDRTGRSLETGRGSGARAKVLRQFGSRRGSKGESVVGDRMVLNAHGRAEEALRPVVGLKRLAGDDASSGGRGQGVLCRPQDHSLIEGESPRQGKSPQSNRRGVISPPPSENQYRGLGSTRGYSSLLLCAKAWNSCSTPAWSASPEWM